MLACGLGGLRAHSNTSKSSISEWIPLPFYDKSKDESWLRCSCVDNMTSMSSHNSLAIDTKIKSRNLVRLYALNEWSHNIYIDLTVKA